MLVADFNKQPGERLRKGINFAGWLFANETIASYSVVVTSEDDVEQSPAMTVAADGEGSEISSDQQMVLLRFDGGTDGVTYIVTLTVVTSPYGQRKEVEIRVTVQEE